MNKFSRELVNVAAIKIPMNILRFFFFFLDKIVDLYFPASYKMQQRHGGV